MAGAEAEAVAAAADEAEEAAEREESDDDDDDDNDKEDAVEADGVCHFTSCTYPMMCCFFAWTIALVAFFFFFGVCVRVACVGGRVARGGCRCNLSCSLSVAWCRSAFELCCLTSCPPSAVPVSYQTTTDACVSVFPSISNATASPKSCHVRRSFFLRPFLSFALAICLPRPFRSPARPPSLPSCPARPRHRCHRLQHRQEEDDDDDDDEGYEITATKVSSPAKGGVVRGRRRSSRVKAAPLSEISNSPVRA